MSSFVLDLLAVTLHQLAVTLDGISDTIDQYVEKKERGEL